jgi:hypothetical protein
VCFSSGQRHRIGRRGLAKRAEREEHRHCKHCAEHDLVGYDASPRRKVHSTIGMPMTSVRL